MVAFAPVTVNVLGLKFNAVDNAATVNIGPNQSIDFFLSYKRNQGVGEQNGDLSPILFSFSFVSDPDLNDSATMKNSIV